MCYKVKSWFGYDDALDTFGVHAIGGTLGAIMTGMLARNAVNGNLATNLKAYVTDSCFQPLVMEQLKAVGVTLVLSRGRHNCHRLHHQDARRPASDRRSRNALVSTNPNTAK